MSIYGQSLDLCKYGRVTKEINGSVTFVCSVGANKGFQCPYVRICKKTMDYKMVDSIKCDDRLKEKGVVE